MACIINERPAFRRSLSALSLSLSNSFRFDGIDRHLFFFLRFTNSGNAGRPQSVPANGVSGVDRRRFFSFVCFFFINNRPQIAGIERSMGGTVGTIGYRSLLSTRPGLHPSTSAASAPSDPSAGNGKKNSVKINK